MSDAREPSRGGTRAASPKRPPAPRRPRKAPRACRLPAPGPTDTNRSTVTGLRSRQAGADRQGPTDGCRPTGDGYRQPAPRRSPQRPRPPQGNRPPHQTRPPRGAAEGPAAAQESGAAPDPAAPGRPRGSRRRSRVGRPPGAKEAPPAREAGTADGPGPKKDCRAALPRAIPDGLPGGLRALHGHLTLPQQQRRRLSPCNRRGALALSGIPPPVRAPGCLPTGHSTVYQPRPRRRELVARGSLLPSSGPVPVSGVRPSRVRATGSPGGRTGPFGTSSAGHPAEVPSRDFSDIRAPKRLLATPKGCCDLRHIP